MGEGKFTISRSNLLTIVIALAVVAVAITAFTMATAPVQEPSSSTGLVTAQVQGTGNSGAQSSKALAQLPDMVGGC